MNSIEKGDQIHMSSNLARKAILKISLFFLCLFILSANVVRTCTTEQWLSDLDFVVTRIKAMHPNPYAKITQPGFEKEVLKAREAISRSQSDIDAYLVLRAFVASLQDGHTYLTGRGDLPLSPLRVPLYLESLADGIFIGGTREEDKAILGSRVMAIGGIPIQEAIARLQTITSADTPYSRRSWALNLISYPVFLQGLGIISHLDEVTFKLVDKNDQQIEYRVPSLADITGKVTCTIKSLLGSQIPLHQKHPQKKYWLEHLEQEKALYFQFNSVADEGGDAETFAQFSQRLWAFVDDHPGDISKLIIDLRNNGGGNGRMVIPFIKEIIKRDRINRTGSLFVLVGQETYSAAMVMVNELLQYTAAVFVGDPPGCPSNLFSNKVLAGVLPNSRLQLYVATRQIDNAWSPSRDFFPPDIPAPMSSRDLFAGRDPAMELILWGDPRPLTVIAQDEGVDAALTYHRNMLQKHGDLEWWNTSQNLEDKVNTTAYTLLRDQNPQKAETLFTLNTVLFPKSANAWDSLAEIHIMTLRVDRAKALYRQSLELDQYEKNHVRNVENFINRTGYALLKEEKIDQALAVFTLNTELFPQSANAWDSLGETYYTKKELPKALTCYKKSISLNPENSAGQKMIQQIEKEIGHK